MGKGYIKISDELYKNDWSKLFIFMKDFRPLHIEFRHWENDVWYFYGESKYFNQLKEGEKAPQYDVVFTDNSGIISYEFKKVD